MHWLEVAFWGACGAIGSNVYRWWLARAKNPYRWDCPECNFRIEANKPEIVKNVKETHRHG